MHASERKEKLSSAVDGLTEHVCAELRRSVTERGTAGKLTERERIDAEHTIAAQLLTGRRGMYPVDRSYFLTD